VAFRIHRRHVFALAGLVSALVVAALAWAIVWATHYAPLEPGSLSSGLGPHGTMLKAAAGSDGKDVLYVDARPGSTFQVAFSIRNGGSRGVTLLGPPAPGAPAEAGLFPVLSASIGPHDDRAYPRQFQALTSSRPASLRAGDDRLVYFTLRVNGRCDGSVARSAAGAHTVSSVATIPMRYRVLGLFTRTQQLALPYNLALACRSGGLATG
jgi:hypothetical protein